MGKEHLFSEESKKGLVGKTITHVGDDYITLDGTMEVYIDDNNEIKHINECHVRKKTPIDLLNDLIDKMKQYDLYQDGDDVDQSIKNLQIKLNDHD